LVAFSLEHREGRITSKLVLITFLQV